jgi:hypothetical protein
MEGSTGGKQAVHRPSARALGILLAVNILAMSGIMYGMISMNHKSGKTAKLWTFWECTYFIVITATTIGLGDLVPQMHRKGKIVQFCAQFLLILITWAIFAAAIQANEEVLERKAEDAVSRVKRRASLGKKSATELWRIAQKATITDIRSKRPTPQTQLPRQLPSLSLPNKPNEGIRQPRVPTSGARTPVPPPAPGGCDFSYKPCCHATEEKGHTHPADKPTDL